ncbi:feruloyl-CoA synthase [Pseudomonas japonica]|uniref:feruloyl-CoA synthase n=1 Tax=Pseudomonas japonica TaxID=256466 RepID=UPI0015E3F401|nr:feruloyl-CoA synthase [Pseudomonas japonica]MBA1243560.1 feruloyl-CoA synthase [Pseudomonas japonica]
MDSSVLGAPQALQAPLRAVAIGQPGVSVRREGDTLYLHSTQALAPYPQRLMERLRHWAQGAPERTFVARRDATGAWQRITYSGMLERARGLGAWLLEQNLGPERPLVILSGNDLEHVVLATAALYVGVPYCPVSPAYSLVSKDYGKLRHIVETLQPGLVYAADGAYEGAVSAVIPEGVPVILGKGQLAHRHTLEFDNLEGDNDLSRADAAFNALTAEHIAKFLFTSGSTHLPKGVITTQGMLCANQQMLLQTFPAFAEEPPVLVDWLPWNHTFGGSHNVGIVLYNGGTLYIDDGKPTPQAFEHTLANLREISPTAYLTVPKGWEELVKALEIDQALRQRFFARIKLFFFAGAGLSQAIWDRLDRVSIAHCGERIRMMAGLGMTETSPSCTFTTGPLSLAGYVGLPAPGCEVKLAPVDGKYEARFRGPHVMPGYWRSPAQSEAAFDEEGFYRSGDALRLADPADPQQGLMFDGRIAEDFKLSSGVFVSVGPLRTRVILEGAPYVLDVVVLAPDREQLGLLIFPRMPECRALAGLAEGRPDEEILCSAPLRQWLANLLQRLNRDATGSASRLAWAAFASEPPSIDRGEITDKGSINQRAVHEHRALLIDALYAGEHPLRVEPV